MSSITVQERFWRRVAVRELHECWPWLGSLSRGGYGSFYIDGKTECAHRMAYKFYYGIDLGDWHVCHHCDNPGCMNPFHLFLGTNADNIADKVRKGRQSRTQVSGEDNGQSKLTKSQVTEIRNLYAAGGITQDELGQQFGIHSGHVSFIVRGEYWQDADGPISLNNNKGRSAPGILHHNARLTSRDVLDIRTVYARGDITQAALARQYGMAETTIGDIVRGEKWKHVGGPITKRGSGRWMKSATASE